MNQTEHDALQHRIGHVNPLCTGSDAEVNAFCAGVADRCPLSVQIGQKDRCLISQPPEPISLPVIFLCLQVFRRYLLQFFQFPGKIPPDKIQRGSA